MQSHVQDRGGGDARHIEINDGFDPNWNPMKEAFEDKTFNSYESGPGRDLLSSNKPTSQNHGTQQSQEGVQLYVTGIPNEMTEQGVKNTFSQAGDVLKVRKMVSHQGSSDDTYGFVTMSCIRDAEIAIQKLNKFPIQNGKFRLGVRMAITKEERERRQNKKMEEEEFVKQLPSTRAENGEDIRNVEIKQQCSPQSGLGRLNKVHQAIHMEVADESPSPHHSGHPSPAASLLDLTITRTPDGQRDVHTRQSDASLQPKMCAMCEKHATKRCLKCKKPYCSKDCQLKDWPIHKKTCGKPTPKPVSVNTTTQQDFESRFEVDIGDDLVTKMANELVKNKDVLKELTAKPSTASEASQKPAQQPLVNGDVGHAPGQDKSPSSRLLYANAKKTNLQGKAKIVVSFFENPSDFWVTRLDMQPVLQELLVTLGQHYGETTNQGATAFCPEVGLVCAAQFSSDKAWYRCRVDRLMLDGTVRVTFVDYGNSEEMSVTSTRKLLSKFADHPLQAVRCCLNHIEPVGIEWTLEARQHCALLMDGTKPHDIIVQGNNADKIVVDFINSDGLNVAEVLVKESHAKNKSEKSSVAISKQPTPTPVEIARRVITPTKMPQPAAVANQPQVTSPSASKSAPVVVPPSIHKAGRLGIPPPPIPTAAQYMTCNKIMPLQVLEVASPSEFWAQIIDENKAVELQKLRQEMNTHYNKLPPKTGFTPLVKKLYACKFSLDKEWYRAQVIDFDTMAASVLYLDHGNREKVAFSQLHSLESTHCSMPFQAIRCSLHGVVGTGPDGTWTREAIEFFCQHVSQGVHAKLMHNDDVFCDVLVKLPDKSMLIQKMLEAGLAILESNTPATAPTTTSTKGPQTTAPQTKAPQTTTSRFMVADMPQIDPPKVPVVVTVAHAPGPLDFVVQILSDPYQLTVISVMTAMGTFQQTTGPYTPIVGELIAAQFQEDKAWYRAEVMKIVPPDQFVVKFIDYGNLEPVFSSAIAQLPLDMTKCPALGVQCRLANVTLNPKATWKPAMLLNQSFTMSVVSQGRDSLVVELSNKESKQMIGNQLIELGYVVQSLDKNSVCTVVSRKDLNTPQYKPGTVLEDVMVTDATSPLDFTIQHTVSSMKVLCDLEGLLAELHKDYVGVYVPSIHELVTAKYIDSLWYRASVTDVKDKKVCMTLVDYGNQHEVDASQVNKLDPGLLSFPVLGIRCALAGVESVNPTKSWEERHLFPLTKRLQLKVVEFVDNIHHVELIDGDTCINSSLLKLGVVFPVKSKSTPVLDSETTRPEPPAKPQPVTKPAPVTKPEPAPEPAVIPKAYIKAVDVKIQEVSATDALGVTTHLVSPAEFYMMCVEGNTVQGLTECLQILEKMYTGSKDVHRAVVGELVACYCDNDTAWYRAEVKVTQGDKVTVLYVDFGNEECIPADNIRRLDQVLTKLPKQAIRCQFERDLVFSEKGVDRLATMIKDKSIGFLFAGVDGDSLIVKDAYVPQNGSSVIQEMLQQGLITRAGSTSVQQPVAPAVQTTTEVPPGVFMLDRVETQHLPDSNVHVVITHVTSPSDFVLNVTEEWVQNEMLRFMKPLNEYCLSTQQLYTPTVVNQLVCAKYQGVWYRAAVIDLLSQDRFKLKFIDYGNVEEVPTVDIREMQEAFLELKRQGVQCCMQGVVGTHPSGEWSSDEKQWFAAKFLEQDLALKPTNEKRADVNVIDLLMEGGVVSQFMLSEKKARRPEATAKPVPPQQTKPSPTPQSKMGDKPTVQPPTPHRTSTLSNQPDPVDDGSAKLYTLKDLPKTDIPADMNVAVVVVQTPGLFQCQNASPEAQASVAVISAELQNNYTSTKPDSNLRLRVGELCVAFSKQFNEFYRASVLSEVDPGRSYTIQYTDFGDIATLETENLRPLIPSLRKHPMLAIHCSISAVAPIGPSWQLAATEAFKSITIGQGILRMQIVGSQDDVKQVTLSKDGSDLASELVKQGLAISTLKQESKASGASSTATQPPQPMAPPTSTTQTPQVAPPDVDLAEQNRVLKQEMEKMKLQLAELMKHLPQKM